jgi:hypothetical protein
MKGFIVCSRSSAYIIRVMKSRLTSYLGHVARIGNIGNTYSVSVRRPEGSTQFWKKGVGGKIILKCILKNV